MEETLRVLMSLGLGLLLVLLRLDAERFGAAEYDERVGGQGPPLRSRLAWYLLGVGLIAAVLFIHPDPANGLGLGLGERGLAIVWGFCYGALGALIALGVAWLRYGRLRLPDPSSYPGALTNALFTAFIDEATFRGIVLGLLLVAGLDPWPAVVIQALIYALVTRTGAPGRPWQMLVVSLVIGVVGGPGASARPSSATASPASRSSSPRGIRAVSSRRTAERTRSCCDACSPPRAGGR
jgi:hypothetical protein